MEDIILDELWREKLITQWMEQLTNRYTPQSILIRDITVLQHNYISPVQTSILIENGLITKIDPHLEDDTEVTIEGSGKYILPGLIDMHIHTRGSNAHHLLNLLQGITYTREMCGFPWMLKRREMIKQQDFLGPRMVVAGTMLNYRPFYQFTRVVRTEEEIKTAIAEQVDAGYDLIKVWNHMPPDLLQIIGNECRDAGIDLSGHIPNDVTIEEAVKCGFRTMEHLKGYIIDSGVVLTDEDYVTSTPSDGAWNCPTFVIFHFQSLIGDQGVNQLENMEENQFISPYIRQQWVQHLLNREKEVNERGRNVPLDHINLQNEIFRDLLDNQAPYIIGTDFGGGYPLCVPGFGLLRELEYMHETFDIPYSELLKRSTTVSAKVLRKEDHLGSIETGQIADLLILEHDPREYGIPIDTDKHIITAGRYISASDRVDLLNKIKTFYKEPIARSQESVLDQLMAYYLDEKNLDFLKPTFISLLSSYLKDRGNIEDAIKIANLNLQLLSTYMDYYTLGELYLEMNSIKKTEEMWKKSLELNPYFDELRERLNNLHNK